MADPVYLDCDGVLLDFVEGFSRFAAANGIARISEAPPGSFDMLDIFAVTKPEMRDLIRRYTAGEGGAFGEMVPMPGAPEAVADLAHSGRRIVVVTSCGDSDETRRLRRDNLYRVFGDAFAEIHCLPLSGSKADLLSSLPAGHFVDDLAKHAMDGIEAGHGAHVVRMGYNREDEGPGSGIVWHDDLRMAVREILETVGPEIS